MSRRATPASKIRFRRFIHGASDVSEYIGYFVFRVTWVSVGIYHALAYALQSLIHK